MDRAYPDRHAAGRSQSPVAARAAAMTALLAAVAMFMAILLDGPDRAPAAGSVLPELEEMSASFGAMARALEDLEPGRKAAPARRKVHAALADVDGLRARVRNMRAAGALGESMRLDNALDAAHEYIDAVGSLLSNPRSLLRHRLPSRARRAKAAFAALPEPAGLPATVRGWQRLQQFAAQRRRD